MSDFLDSETNRLLIVDDELSVREILAEGLASFGYDARPVGNVAEAMESIRNDPPHLVLTDIEMPGESGLDLLRQVKTLHPELDVVMVTGVVDARTAIGAIRDGASDYLTKPFNLDEVQIVVERTLEKRRLVLENRRYQDHLEDLVRARTAELEEKGAELQELYVTTLQALVTALDYRDNETQGHSLRVVEYAVLVAEAMDIREPDLTWIRRGALLHDVGKIGITDSVLRKPGKLDDDEWEEMHKHPEMGFRMLQKIPFLGPELDIVLCHQEKFDGTGYPRGLKGDEIPLGARIFSVVDTFDAMTSDRPYRAALSIEDACEEIAEFAGRQFDPTVAEAFLSISADRWRKIRERVHTEVQELQTR
ncbi:MAG: response regulator [Acidobacteriota bacterium]|nr:response regulator [Acidobacteriota bacterium]